ncbi:MAG: DMT family transporter [Candidatus Diapherotrites archaeon]|nr:DMT family transporter [Candidatus Diapherotrites archaeon]
MFIPIEVVFGFGAMASYGLADFLAKNVVEDYGPIRALKRTLFIGTFAVFAYSIFFVSIPTTFMNGLVFGLLAGFAGAVGWGSFYKALGQGRVSVVSPIASSWGIVTFVLALIVLSEKITFTQIVLSLTIFLGVFLVSLNWKEVVTAFSKRLESGAALALLAMVSFGVYGVLAKFVVDAMGVFYTVVFTRMVTLAFLFLIPSEPIKKGKTDSLFFLLVIVGFLDVLGFLSFNAGLSVGLVSIVSAVTSAAPLVAVILAHMFLKERLHLYQYAGMLLIIVGFVGLALLS